MDSSGEILVQIRELTLTYHPPDQKQIHALAGIDLEIHAGEIVGILGESGCGKSTLASALLNLLPAHARSRGEILFCGRDLLRLPESDLRAIRGAQISLIHQDPLLALNPVMTVVAQIEEVLRSHLSMTRGERHARALELLREVGFAGAEEIAKAYPHQLSGGQRQRVVIAQAVACRPALLMADEPTSKLDASLQAEIIGLLSRIRERHGTAILMISHDPALLAGFADRIAVMYAGRVIELGRHEEVLGRPLHPYTQALVRIARSAVAHAESGRGRFPAIDGESFDPTTLFHGCPFEPRCADRMKICAERYPSLHAPEPSRPVHCFKYGE